MWRLVMKKLDMSPVVDEVVLQFTCSKQFTPRFSLSSSGVAWSENPAGFQTFTANDVAASCGIENIIFRVKISQLVNGSTFHESNELCDLRAPFLKGQTYRSPATRD